MLLHACTKLSIPMLRSTLLFAFLGSVLSFSSCVHTPPGTSVEVALAKKAELVRLPAPPPPTPAELAKMRSSGAVVAKHGAVEPELPSNNKVEMVADAFTRGQFCMKAGNDAEAITAFEETVKLDPQFTDAWHCLAVLYEKNGQEKKALEAFRKSKKLARG